MKQAQALFIDRITDRYCQRMKITDPLTRKRVWWAVVDIWQWLEGHGFTRGQFQHIVAMCRNVNPSELLEIFQELGAIL